MSSGLRVKWPLLWSDFSKNRHFCKKSWKILNIKFYKNTCIWSRVAPCWRTDRRDEANIRFRNFDFMWRPCLLPASGVIISFYRLFHKRKYSDHIQFGVTLPTTHVTSSVPLSNPGLHGEHWYVSVSPFDIQTNITARVHTVSPTVYLLVSKFVLVLVTGLEGLKGGKGRALLFL
jgi:hypothetical protein